MDHSDEALVRAAAGQDRDAFASIYRRHADGVYDVCCAILGDRHEAQDAMQDVFLVAGSRIHQLRDPARLRAWLFAIARHHCFRRRGVLDRTVLDLREPAVTEPSSEPEVAVEAAAAVALVRDAARGLSERDQLVLDLHLRHGLEGEDLALALGTTAPNAYVWLSRAKDQLEICVTVLVIARDPGRRCGAMAALIDRWDGTLTPLLRKRLNRHIDHCEDCREQRRRAPAMALYGDAPVLAAPIASFEAVMERLELASVDASEGWRADGFPAGARRSPRRAWVAVAAGLVAAVLAIVLARQAGDVDVVTSADSQRERSGASTTGPEPSAEPSEPSDDPPAPGTPSGDDGGAPTGEESTGPSAGGGPGVRPGQRTGELRLDRTSIDAGLAEAVSINVHNTGDAPLVWSTETDATWLVVSPERDVVTPGATETVVFTVDRSALQDGVVSDVVAFHGPTAVVNVTLTAEVAHPPVIADLSTHGDFCELTLGATVTDDTGVAAVSASYDAGSVHRTVTMAPVGGGRYEVQLDPIESASVVWRVVASDAAGNGEGRPVAGPDVHQTQCPG